MRFDVHRGQFEPFLSGVQGNSLSISRDGAWIAYVTSPDEVLWRSRLDGSERLQLTSGTLHAADPRWSPDGTQIVFSGGPGGHASRIYSVSSAGGAPEPLTDGSAIDEDPDWSADGQSLVFARYLTPGATGQPGLYVLDAKTHAAAFVAGSQHFYHPSWSPDGRSIAAAARDRILVLNVASSQWTTLASGSGFGSPYWSKDGKFVYYQETLAAQQPVYRSAIARAKKELVLTAQQVPQSNSIGFALAGLAQGDAPIATVIYSNSDIYALEVELP